MKRIHLPHDWFSKPLPDNVQMGERSWLYSSFAFIHYRSRAELGLFVGHDTGLYHGTFFDLGPDATVQIGDYCSLVGAIIATNGRVAIGSYSLIAHEVVIADSHFASPDARSVFGGELNTDHEITIGENVWVGAQAILLGNVTIGDNSIIGAATLVTENVPANSVFAGNPGRVVGEVSESS